MKSQFVQSVLIAGLTVLGSLTLSAQDKVEIATIPFAFTVNHKAMPAGDYSVKSMNTSGIFQLTAREGGSVFVTANGLKENKAAQPHLSFACAEGDCVLSQIWMPGSNQGNLRSDAAVDRDMQHKLSMAAMINIALK